MPVSLIVFGTTYLNLMCFGRLSGKWQYSRTFQNTTVCWTATSMNPGKHDWLRGWCEDLHTIVSLIQELQPMTFLLFFYIRQVWANFADSGRQNPKSKETNDRSQNGKVKSTRVWLACSGDLIWFRRDFNLGNISSRSQTQNVTKWIPAEQHLTNCLVLNSFPGCTKA